MIYQKRGSMYTISEIQDIIKPRRSYLADTKVSIHYLLYDSRKIAHEKLGVFFAFTGRQDGHLYIQDAYNKGVRNFILEKDTEQEVQMPDANILWVANSWTALQSLAQHNRSRFQGPVIGITGSNGKTIVKEWLFQLMSPEYKIYRSPKSYNSQLGVALSLWDLSNQYNLAIIEAGISHVGEMDRLEAMIKPTFGVLTNIGIAHQQGFASKLEKTEEKLRLFKDAETLIYPAKYLEAVQIPYKPRKLSWGEEEDNQLEVYSIRKPEDGQTYVTLYYGGKTFGISVPFTDSAAMENAITCVAVMLRFGYDTALIAERIRNLLPVEMRLELKNGKNNTSVIDDSYSNDLVSLQIALDFLNQQHQHTNSILILSDIPGVTLTDEKNLNKLKRLVADRNLTQLILIGPVLRQYAEQLGVPFQCYASTADFIANLKDIEFRDATILLKGARDFHFEDISKLLVAKSHDTVLEINLNALEHNLNVYRGLVPKEVKMMAMVKAFSYGSGSFEIANLLQFNQVDYLTVAYADEGVELRNAGITLPIVVMSPDENAFESVVQHNLELEIYSFRILHAFISFVRIKDLKNFPIHIKVDTGMHRLGFMPDEAEALIDILRQQDVVRVQSAFSHLASAANPQDNAFTAEQILKLDQFAKKLQQELGYSFLRHIAATSGIELWPSAYFDMVRLGIGMYGVEASRTDLSLQTVGVLKTNVTQIKHIPASETVGYNRHGVLHRDSKIATIKIGYADGYDRRFGNGVGKMLVNGHLVPTVGDICMDMCMLDVTDIAVSEEDEVVVFPDITAAANSIGTIPYELLVNISQRVKRVYFYE